MCVCVCVREREREPGKYVRDTALKGIRKASYRDSVMVTGTLRK